MRQLTTPRPLSQALDAPQITVEPFARYERHAEGVAGVAPGMVRAALMLAGVDPSVRIFGVPRADPAFVVASRLDGYAVYASYRPRERRVVTDAMVGQLPETAVAVGAWLLVHEQPFVINAMRPLVNEIRHERSIDENVGRLAAAAATALAKVIDEEFVRHPPLWFASANLELGEIEEVDQPLVVELASRFADPAFYTSATRQLRRAIRAEMKER